MTKVEAAQRLGVHETAVVSVADHPAGCVVTLRDGRVMLVSETTARAYVREVDDPEFAAAGRAVEAMRELATAEGATVKKTAASKKGAKGAASS